MTTHGQFNWNELQTRNAEAAIAFYSATVGWEFQAEEMPSGGTYWIGFASGEPVCGILTLESAEGSPENGWWVTYVHVDDLDNAVDQVKMSGGSVLKAPWNVPGVGRIAWVRDPGGAEIGLVTPGK